jgi:hypothetical protein
MLGRKDCTREELDGAGAAVDERRPGARVHRGRASHAGPPLRPPAARVLRTGTVVTYVPEQTVLGLQAGDRIVLGIDAFARIAEAFLTELEKRFVG